MLANLAIPDIASPQLTLIEPDLNAGGPQCIANPLSRLGILRGVAQEHRSRWCARRLRRLVPHPRPLDPVRIAGECPEQPVSSNSGKRTSAFHRLNGW